MAPLLAAAHVEGLKASRHLPVWGSGEVALQACAASLYCEPILCSGQRARLSRIRAVMGGYGPCQCWP